MQERTYDGNDRLTNNVNERELREALQDERNALVALHRPGSGITDRKGRRYVVNALGQWVRVRERRAKR